MQLHRTLFARLIAIVVVSVALVGQLKVANADYKNALNGVTQVKAVFDVSQPSAFTSNVILWAVRNVYQDDAVKGLSKPPKVAVVFHGPAVKLLSTDKKHYKEQNQSEVAKFQETLRQMKADGVNIEVCVYALKVFQVDPKTVIPAIDQVGNGFISIVGYQAQGYEVVRIP